MRVDVLIIGAGPSGLVLALWLTRQGIGVRIIDRSAGPGTTSRAMAVQARTLELYRQLDLAERVVAAGHPNPSVNLWALGQKRATIIFGDAGAMLTPYPFLLIYPQDQHERLLGDRLGELGVTVERETELLGFEERGDHVVANLRGPSGETTCEASWIAGCDGARSTVRHAVGAGFPGGTYARTFYVADVAATGAAAGDGVNVALDHADFAIWFSRGTGGAGRLIGVVKVDPESRRELSFEDVGHEAIARIGLKVAQVNWFSTYRVHHRVTDHYRRGRAFLVGDAAHVHSPVGGQGMNTGIGDAINLAWKLAAVIGGRAPDALLDSYEAERRPFALRLVATTDRMFTLVTAQGGLADLARTRLVPAVASRALGIGALRGSIFRRISQTLISYAGGPISGGRAGGVRGGDRLPWVAGDDNYAPLREIAWQVHVYGTARPDLTDWCRTQGIALHRFDFGPAQAAVGLARDAVYLIRPDSYVALADPHASVATLSAYVARNGLRLS